MGRAFSRKSRQSRRQPPENLAESVNGNGRLAKLPLDELTQHAEVEIMMAGYHLTQYREVGHYNPSTIDQAVEHAEWAVQALREIQRRSG